MYKRQLVAAVVVEIGRVDIKNQLAIMGGIRLQAARGDSSVSFQLGEQVGITGGRFLEMDVPCSALGDNIGVPIAVLFTLIVPVSYTHLDVYKRQLQAATRLHEVGIASNRGSACHGEYVPGPCTHRPSHHESRGDPKSVV